MADPCIPGEIARGEIAAAGPGSPGPEAIILRGRCQYLNSMHPHARSAVAGGLIILVIVISLMAYSALQSPAPNPSGPSGGSATASKATGTKAPGVIPATTQYVQYETLPGDAGQNTLHGVVPVAATTTPVKTIEIFNRMMVLLYNGTAISYNLKNPPMTIDYSVIPAKITDTKWTISREAHKNASWVNGTEFNVTRIDENSWFTVTVMDRNNNNTVVMQDGFGGEYDQDLTKEMVLRDPGYYLIDFRGNYVTASASIRVPKDGNL